MIIYASVPPIFYIKRLVGILTNRDIRFAKNLEQKVSTLMTKDNLITVSENISMDKAQKLLHKHRIEKLLVVDKDFKCVGLITVKDIEKADTILWRYKWKIHVYIYYFHRVANPIDIYYYQATFCLCTE